MLILKILLILSKNELGKAFNQLNNKIKTKNNNNNTIILTKNKKPTKAKFKIWFTLNSKIWLSLKTFKLKNLIF